MSHATYLIFYGFFALNSVYILAGVGDASELPVDADAQVLGDPRLVRRAGLRLHPRKLLPARPLRRDALLRGEDARRPHQDKFQPSRPATRSGDGQVSSACPCAGTYRQRLLCREPVIHLKSRLYMQCVGQTMSNPRYLARVPPMTPGHIAWLWSLGQTERRGPRV